MVLSTHIIFNKNKNTLILVKQEDKKQISIMSTPAGRLMKCFLRDMYMVK